MTHLLTSLMVTGTVLVAKLSDDSTAFVKWAMVFTFVSLAVVVTMMIRTVRLADASARGLTTPTGGGTGPFSVK